MKRIHVQDRSDTLYPEYCGIIEKDGKLYIMPLMPDPGEAVTWESAEAALREVEGAVAVTLFTHTPYANPNRQFVIDLILERAAAELGGEVRAPKQYWRAPPRGAEAIFRDAKVGQR